MYLAWRDLKVGRARFVLVGVVIALVGLLTTLLSGLATGLVDDGISGLRGLPLTHLALQPGAESSFSRSTLTPKELAPWQAAKGVEAAPLVGRYQHRGLGTAFRDGLRPFDQALLQQLAEACLGVLNWPSLHGTSPS